MLMDERGGRERQSPSRHLTRLMCAGEGYILRMWSLGGFFFFWGGGGGRRRDCVEGLFLNRVVFIMSLNEEDPLFVEMPRL